MPIWKRAAIVGSCFALIAVPTVAFSLWLLTYVFQFARDYR